jgi:hypothetical protein
MVACKRRSEPVQSRSIHDPDLLFRHTAPVDSTDERIQAGQANSGPSTAALTYRAACTVARTCTRHELGQAKQGSQTGCAADFGATSLLNEDATLAREVQRYSASA